MPQTSRDSPAAEPLRCFSCGDPIETEVVRYIGATPGCDRCLGIPTTRVGPNRPASGRSSQRATLPPAGSRPRWTGLPTAATGVVLVLIPLESSAAAPAGGRLVARGQALVVAGAVLGGIAWRRR